MLAQRYGVGLTSLSVKKSSVRLRIGALLHRWPTFSHQLTSVTKQCNYLRVKAEKVTAEYGRRCGLLSV